MFRGQGLGTEDVARAATHHFTRKNLYREHGEGEKDRCDAATHLFARKNLYREHRKREKGRCDAATHHFTRKNLCREHGEGEKDEPKPHHTAQHDTIIPQNKTTPHHITSYHNHIQTRQHYQQTNPIPYLKHHTPPHYTTKSSSPETGGRALLICLRTD